MLILTVVLFAFAIVLFILAAYGTPSPPWNLGWAGCAFLTGALFLALHVIGVAS